MKRVCMALLLAAMVTGVMAPPMGERVEAAVKKVYVTKGEDTSIKVKKATGKTRWKVSKKGTVKLSSKKSMLNVKGTGKGTVKVSAVVGKKKVSYQIVVETPKISAKSLSLKVGDTKHIKINGTKRSVKWKSKNPAIASVDSKSGRIKARKEGNTRVYAKLGKKTYSCNVRVQASSKAKPADTKPADTTQTSTEQTNPTVKLSWEALRIPNGNREIYGRIYRPEGKEGKLPVVILSHGYNGIASDFAVECKYFMDHGYIAYALDFCGGSTRSKSTGLTTTEMTIFSEKEDLVAVFSYFKNMDGVDTDRIYLLGGSQGGLVTALAAAELKEQVRGIALYFPAFCIPDNWRASYPDVNQIPEVTPLMGMNLGRNFFVSIHDFDPYTVIGDYKGSVHIWHGDKDNLVPLSYSQEAQKLYEQAELTVIEGAGHGFARNVIENQVEIEVLQFMENNK